MLLDIRARELSQWRQAARTLTAQLAQMEETAKTNDRILLALHKLAVVLIKKRAAWQKDVENLLKKELSLPYCRLHIFGDKDNALASACTRLPAAGKITSSAWAEYAKWKDARIFFYLPLKKGGSVVGLLALASRQKNAFPEDAARDFSRRLAALLTAAI